MRRRLDRFQSHFLLRVHPVGGMVGFLSVFFSLWLGVAPGNAQEKPKLQQRHLNGILAALDDGYPGVQQKAFEKLAEFDAADLKAFPQQAAAIESSAIEVLKTHKENTALRLGAAQALGTVGKPDLAVQVLTDLLNHSKADFNLRLKVVQALRTVSRAYDATPTAVQVLSEVVNSKTNPTLRAKAAQALKTIGNPKDSNPRVVQVLTEFLKNRQEDPDLRLRAVQAMGMLGKTNPTAVQVLTELLRNRQENSLVRISAAQELGTLGKTNSAGVQVLMEFLRNQQENPLIRIRAAQILGTLSKPNSTVVQVLTGFLKDNQEDILVRTRAAQALATVGKTNSAAVQVLNEFLNSKPDDDEIRVVVAQALEALRPLSLGELFLFIERTHDRSFSDFDERRFVSYFYGRGDAEIATLLQWIGLPKRETIPSQLTRDQAQQALAVFAKAWEPSQEFPESRAELTDAIAKVTQLGNWQPEDITLLESHYKNLKDAQAKDAAVVKASIEALTFWKYFNLLRNLAIAHLVLWSVLFLLYPKSAWIQAHCFWNPWIRKIGGAGYINFLLTRVPFLSHRLFEPFRDSLLADANLHQFTTLYFPDSEVTLKGTNQPQPIQTVFSQIKGQSILEGESGLGKTSFLRHLVKASQRIVVYLPAQKCEQGVIEAIQAKLPKPVKDTNFLGTLIDRGAIDLCIDGLNEVAVDTRATIAQFAKQFCQSNLLMATQPLAWSAPSAAKTYVLQPLKPEHIKPFLMSRQSTVPTSATYATDCDRYLESALSLNQSPEARLANQRILSNPMDLTIVAQLLAQGKIPDLGCLPAQQYKLMEIDYHQIYSQDFPLQAFSEAVYQCRLNDDPTLPGDQFYNELISMESSRQRMVLSRQWKDAQGKIQKEWYFQHDKIAGFFIVQTFLGNREAAQARIKQHLGDPRFRGIYFLLAMFLSIDDAQVLREMLIDHAAETQDHTVSDRVVQWVRDRKMGREAREPQAPDRETN